MSTAVIRKKLHSYIDTAQDKKIRAIFAMVEDEIKEPIFWSDEFLSELNKRAADFEKGKIRMDAWKDVKQRARRNSKAKSA
jgi:hypothetical protein